MLMQFPRAHDDELLGSVLARFIHRQGIKDDKVALKKLFGSRNIVPSAVLQGHADELLSNMGHLWVISPRDMLEKHTLLPIFRPFVSETNYESLIQDLSGRRKNHSMLRSGLNASNIVWPLTFRTCPLCHQEQLRTFGYAYWRRLFQCPGVDACPKHLCMLIDTGIPLQSARRHRFVGVDSWLQTPCNVSPLADPKTLALSALVEELLRYRLPASINSHQWSRFYRDLASRSGLCSGKGVQHKEIAFRIKELFETNWLADQGLALIAEDNWLVSIFRKHRRPFTYLQHFLCWFALEDDHPVTVTRILKEVSQFSDQPPEKAVYYSSRAKKVSCEYRATWKELVSRHGSLKSIREQREGARVYSWLYRFDRQWLAVHKPEKLKSPSQQGIDWAARDLSIVRELLAVERGTWSELDGPRRSRNWYCRQISRGKVLQKKLSKLPLCRAFFVRYVETIEEYQVRRLACIFSRLLVNNQWLTPIHEIERSAGLDQEKCRKAGREILEQSIPAWQFSEPIPYRLRSPTG